MLFITIFSLIQTKNKICVCNNKCPSLCKHSFDSKAVKQNFEKFLAPYLKNKNEIELNFYSKQESISFDLDVSYFGATKICLTTLLDSKPAIVTLKKCQLPNKTIQIDPMHRICLPDFTNFQRSTIQNLNDNEISHQSQTFMPNNDEYHPKSISTGNEPKITNDQAFSKYTQQNLRDHLRIQSIPMDDPEFYIVSCNDLSYTGWHVGFNSGDAYQGSYSNNVNDKATYKFNGTKVQIYSTMKDDSGIATIKIDGSTYETDFYRQKEELGMSFTSDYMPFGEHTIEISPSGKNLNQVKTHLLLLHIY